MPAFSADVPEVCARTEYDPQSGLFSYRQQSFGAQDREILGWVLEGNHSIIELEIHTPRSIWSGNHPDRGFIPSAKLPLERMECLYGPQCHAITIPVMIADKADAKPRLHDRKGFHGRKLFHGRADLLFQISDQRVELRNVDGVVSLLVLSEQEQVGHVLRTMTVEEQFVLLLN